MAASQLYLFNYHSSVENSQKEDDKRNENVEILKKKWIDEKMSDSHSAVIEFTSSINADNDMVCTTGNYIAKIYY